MDSVIVKLSNVEITENKSPLRYPGGKSKACKVIYEQLIKYVDLSKFKDIASPFFGGGSFEFYISNKYDLNVYANDLFTPLISFWQAVKDDKDNLCTQLTGLQISKEQYNELKKNIILQTGLEQAVNYFIINRCSFSGAICGGYSKQAAEKRFTDSSINRIAKLRLDKFIFSNLDYNLFLKTVPVNTLIFCDPPYLIDSNLYGLTGDLHKGFDHHLFADTIKKYNNWLICYNDCSTIRDLYKEYQIISVNWSYSMTQKKSSEILIFNFS